MKMKEAKGLRAWKRREVGGEGDFITEICQRHPLIMSFIFLSNTSH